MATLRNLHRTQRVEKDDVLALERATGDTLGVEVMDAFSTSGLVEVDDLNQVIAGRSFKYPATTTQGEQDALHSPSRDGGFGFLTKSGMGVVTSGGGVFHRTYQLSFNNWSNQADAVISDVANISALNDLEIGGIAATTQTDQLFQKGLWPDTVVFT